MRKLAFGALCLLVFTIPWQNIVLVANVGTITRTVGLAAAAVAMLAVLRSGKMRPLRGFHVVVGLYAGWTVLSLLWSVNPASTIVQAQTVVQLAFMVWLIWEFARTELQQRRILGAYVAGAWVSAIAVAYPWLYQGVSVRRYTVGDFNANLIGMLVAIGIPISIYLASAQSHRLWRWAILAYVPLGLFGVLLTGSRAAIAAVILSGILVVLIFLRLGVKAKIMTLIFGIGLAYVLLGSVPMPVKLRLSSLGVQVSDRALPFRIEIWRSGLSTFDQSPVLGVGAGTYRYAAETVLGHTKSAHNAFVSSLVELGPIGLGLFLTIAAIAFRSALRMRASERALWLTLLGMWALVAVFHNSESHKHTWFLLAMAYSVGTWLPISDLARSAQLAGGVAGPPQRGNMIGPTKGAT